MSEEQIVLCGRYSTHGDRLSMNAQGHIPPKLDPSLKNIDGKRPNPVSKLIVSTPTKISVDSR